MKTLINTLFKYNTENTEDAPSINIYRCLLDISRYLKKCGIDSELQEYNVTGNDHRQVAHCNLIAKKPSDNKHKQYVLLQGHIDTVTLGESYFCRVDDEHIIGRGAVDMKGPLAGMIDAFIKIYKQETEYYPMLLITGDEESNDFAGIKEFLKDKHEEITFAINGEATGLTVSRKLRGVMICSFTKNAELGHSSLAKTTLIEDSLPLLDSIYSFIINARLISHTDFGDTVGAITMLHSGKKMNMMPDSFYVHFNLRTVVDCQNYMHLFDQCINGALNGFVPNITHYDPVVLTIPKVFQEKLNNAFALVNKVDYKETVMHAFTEGVFLNRAGIPTIVFGPGDITKAHRKPEEERISIQDIETYSELLQKFMK